MTVEVVRGDVDLVRFRRGGDFHGLPHAVPRRIDDGDVHGLLESALQRAGEVSDPDYVEVEPDELEPDENATDEPT